MPISLPRLRQLRTRPALQLAEKLMAVIGASMFALLALTWFSLNQGVEQLLTQYARQYGHTLANIGANAMAEALLADDRLQLEVMTGNLLRDPTLNGAAIYRLNGERYAESGALPLLDTTQLQRSAALNAEPEIAGASWRFVAPVRFHETQVGYLQLSLNRESLQGALHHSLRRIGIILVVMLALASVVAYWLGRHIAEPIDRLALATRAWRDGQYDALLYERRDDEIGELIHTLNELAQNLQRKQQSEKSLARFVAPAVAQQILQGGSAVTSGQQVHATVMFVDMVGFTRLSEQLPAEQVADVLNRHFRLLNSIVKLYGGSVDKYIGDGAMVLFGAPQSDPEHAFHALCCAQLFLQVAGQMKTQFPFLPDVLFRAGLHSGYMIAGNMGSEDRLQYTVVGDSVNQAARLCENASGGSIWLSADVLAETGVRQRIEVRDRGEVRLKGKQHPTRCFEWLGTQEPYASLLQRQVQHLLAQA